MRWARPSPGHGRSKHLGASCLPATQPMSRPTSPSPSPSAPRPFPQAQSRASGGQLWELAITWAPVPWGAAGVDRARHRLGSVYQALG